MRYARSAAAQIAIATILIVASVAGGITAYPPGAPTATPTSTATSTATATATVGATATATITPTPGGTGWTDSGSLTGVTLGTIDLRPTFESAMVTIPLTESTGTASTYTLEFRVSSGPGTTRNAFPLWKFTDYSSVKHLSGSILLLTAGTQYDIRATVTDNTGHVQVKTGQVTTWSENISTPSALYATATRFVDSEAGDDTHAGTSEGTAWKTLNKVNSTAPSGSVVGVMPGWYPRTSSNYYYANAITLVAKYPAITNDTTRAVETDTTKHSIVYSGTQISPSGTTAQDAGKTLNGGGDYLPSSTWSPLTSTGGHAYYKATGVNNGSNFRLMSFHTLREDTPIAQVAHWLDTDADYATVDAWVNFVYDNQSWHSGFIRNGNDLYMVPPVEMTAAVTAYWWTFEANGSSANYFGIVLDGSNSRISGLRFRSIQTPIQTSNTGSSGSGDTNFIIDHDLFENTCGINLAGYPDGTRSSKNILQYNRWVDTNLASLTDNTKVINWIAMKSNIVKPDGSNGAFRTLADNECSPFTGYKYVTDVVVRNNSFYGQFNGLFTSVQTQTPGSGYGPWDAGSNWDAYSNYLEAVGDDSMEQEGYATSQRLWNNTVVGTNQGISMAPVYYGPLYYFRNTFYRVGPGVCNCPSNTGTGWFKATAQSAGQRVQVYAVHNTVWADPTSGTQLVDAIADAGGGITGNYWYLRNNIVRVAKRYSWQMDAVVGQWDEDYNLFGSTNTTNGAKIAGVSYTAMPAYRTGTGSGSHSNLSSGSDLDPTGTGAGTVVDAIDALLNDVASATGDLSLKTGANIAVDTGTFVPNISDQASQYNGSAPDLGAIER